MGYWTCECGHNTADHNAWWDDDNGSSGMGCDLCECNDMTPPFGWVFDDAYADFIHQQGLSNDALTDATSVGGDLRRAEERARKAEQRKRERESVRASIEGDAEADYIAWSDAEYQRWLTYWHSLTNEERDEERRMMDAHAAEQDERQRAETSRTTLPNGYTEPRCDQ